MIKMSTRSRVLTAGLSLGLGSCLVAASPVHAAPRLAPVNYRLAVIAAPDGSTAGATPVGISDGGQVAVNGSVAYLGNGVSTSRELPSLTTGGAAMVRAIAPNGATAGAGWAGPPSPNTGQRWNAVGKSTKLTNPLPLLEGWASTKSAAANTAGTTVMTYEQFPHPGCGGVVSYTPTGRGTVLTASANGVCTVTGLSEAGTAVGTIGYGWMASGQLPRGVVYTTSGVKDIVPAVPGGVSEVDGISSDGSKLIGRTGAAPTVPPPGTCCEYGTADQPAFLSLTGAPVPLVGAAGLVPTDVNNAGVVVGSKNDRAMVWQNGKLRDLNTLVKVPTGWTLVKAVGVNARGDIAVAARDANFATYAVKLARR